MQPRIAGIIVEFECERREPTTKVRAWAKPEQCELTFERWDEKPLIEATVLCSHCGREHKFIFEEIS